MKRPNTLHERREKGRAARNQAPRGAQADIGKIRRDPVALLRESSKGRIEALIPLRYGRMLESPFAFFRGSAIIQAHDLSRTPNSGLDFQICGDCHLMNFGGFAARKHTLVFDINDFDETAPGPWEWDLKRLAASFAVAARYLDHGNSLADDTVSLAVHSYQEWIGKYSQMSVLDLWQEVITFDRLHEALDTDNARKQVRQHAKRISRPPQDMMLPKLVSQKDGLWRIRDAAPAVFHGDGHPPFFKSRKDWFVSGDWQKLIKPAYMDYLRTLEPDRRQLLSNFRLQDRAFKVAGVGSVGLRCLVLLLIDPLEQPLLLQFKEASQSVVSRYFKAGVHQHDGQRVVDSQRLMQATSDPFLGWTTGPSDRPIYVRQLRDMKASAELELFSKDAFREYAKLCGWALARAHAKAGGMSPELAGYMGDGDQMADALVKYSRAYADQV